MHPDRATEVLIVGGGPAAMAAACCAAESGRQVTVAHDAPTLGGQIWHGGRDQSHDRRAAAWFDRVRAANIQLLSRTQVVAQGQSGRLLAEADEGACELPYEKLILATGGRELLLPFPGWTLPGVTGVGGLQLLVKSGYPIEGKRVAVAGSGPLLLAAAAYLRRRGARVRLIAEQAPWDRLLRFALGLAAAPGRLLQAAGYRLAMPGVRYVAGCWPVEARGLQKLAEVTFRSGRKTWTERCDLLACGFGFVPNLELPTLLGCRRQHAAVQVDRWQETSVSGIYAAGESTGIGGMELALLEGQIAGYAAAGRQDSAARLFPAREKARRFAGSLARAFALRDELRDEFRDPATDETIVCRCEDVTRGRLRRHDSWRAAKLHTRCGMGPCQGRICGAAAEFLFGFRQESPRPPVFPTRLQTLADTRPATLSKPGRK